MTRNPHGLGSFDQLIKACLDDALPTNFPSTLGRLLPANEVQLQNLTHAELIAIYEKVALDMGKKTDKSGVAPAGMTFLGQFVDHDITLDATSAIGSRIVPSTIPNVRTPALDLDCVYGSGPEASPHLYGSNQESEGKGNAADFLVYGTEDNPFDLARTANGTALIGDPRNDENAIVSAIQANMVALHNILMTQAENNADVLAEIMMCAKMGMSANEWADHVPPRHEVFVAVRRFMRMHYQWVIWNELLPDFVDQSCLDEARLNDLFGADAAIMPVEFTGAAYRFGHATTQPDYELVQGEGQKDMFNILGFGRRDTPVQMAMMFDIDGNKAQRARPVGPTLGLPLTNLPFVGSPLELADIGHTTTLPQAKNLPLRNMLRDRYTYKLANGEAVVTWFKNTHHRDLPMPDPHPHLKKHGITKTPLWLYCLMEAEQCGDGKLTGVGGAITASVFGRLLRLDKTSYWHAHGFKPSDMFANDGGVFAGMMKLAEAERGNIAHAEQLRNG